MIFQEGPEQEINVEESNFSLTFSSLMLSKEWLDKKMKRKHLTIHGLYGVILITIIWNIFPFSEMISQKGY